MRVQHGALMMGALLGVLPVIVLFLGLQRYWQAGLAAGKCPCVDIRHVSRRHAE